MNWALLCLALNSYFPHEATIQINGLEVYLNEENYRKTVTLLCSPRGLRMGFEIEAAYREAGKQ